MQKPDMSSAAPALCVVILTHNEEKHIGRALRSIAGLTLATEVFIVDSGSTDRRNSMEGSKILEAPKSEGPAKMIFIRTPSIW
jgi:GT2 family glycosyltransferase